MLEGWVRTVGDPPVCRIQSDRSKLITRSEQDASSASRAASNVMRPDPTANAASANVFRVNMCRSRPGSSTPRVTNSATMAAWEHQRTRLWL